MNCKLFFFIGLCFFIWPKVLANMEIEAVPQGVVVGQPHQQGGTLSFTVTGNDLGHPDPQNHDFIFVRLRFEQGILNQLNMVGWPDQDPELFFEPILLPMELINAPNGAKLAAPQDTVAIVRWWSMEDQIWLVFSHPTNTWIENPQGSLVSPSLQNGYVKFQIGISGDDYTSYYTALYENELANLPTSRRENMFGLKHDKTSDPVSTEFILNLVDLHINVCPAPDCELQFDSISFFNHENVNNSPFQVYTHTVGEFPPYSIGLGGYPLNTTGDDVIAFALSSTQVPILSYMSFFVFIGLLMLIGILSIRKGRVSRHLA